MSSIDGMKNPLSWKAKEILSFVQSESDNSTTTPIKLSDISMSLGIMDATSMRTHVNQLIDAGLVREDTTTRELYLEDAGLRRESSGKVRPSKADEQALIDSFDDEY